MSSVLVPSLLAILLAGPTGKLDPKLRAAVEARVDVARAWAADPVIVAAVRDANAALRTMEEIERIDERWQSTSGLDAFMRSLIDHPAGRRLRALREAHPEIKEAFVTDRLGANVAITNKTSDFFQGDEDKFRVAFAGGRGGLYIGELGRDESALTYSVQIGVPVLDGDEAIGVLVATVNVEKLAP